MDFIAAVTTLVSTALTSPASPTSRSPITLGRIANYREVIPALQLLQYIAAPRPLFLNSRINTLEILLVLHRTPKPKRIWAAFRNRLGEALSPASCLASPRRARASCVLHITFPWTVRSIFAVQWWTFLAT